MLINRNELRQEWLILKDLGLTNEEIIGMMEFFGYELILSPSKDHRKNKKIGGKNV